MEISLEMFSEIRIGEENESMAGFEEVLVSCFISDPLIRFLEFYTLPAVCCCLP